MRIFMLMVPDEFSSSQHMEMQVFYLLPAVISIASTGTETSYFSMRTSRRWVAKGCQLLMRSLPCVSP